MESMVVLFIQLLVARQNHPFELCNNIGAIYGNEQKAY